METNTIKNAQEGQKKALKQIYEDFGGFVYTLAYRMTHNRDWALDLSHDVFVKLFSVIKKFDFKSSFKTWLYKLTVNHVLNAIEKEKNRERILKENVDFNNTYDSIEERMANNSLVRNMLMSLTLEERAILILKFIVGFTYEELCCIFNMPDGTLKSFANRAINKIRSAEMRQRGKNE
ncbi:MAG: sigma-70 family RNA polymerase sigma factor [Elusimicrobiota bacterium]